MMREKFYDIDAGAHCSRGERRSLELLAARELGRSICFGGGGGGSSSSNATTTTTQQTDKRQVVDGQSVGVSSDSSTVNVQVLDGDAFKQAIDFANAAGSALSSNYNNLVAATVALAAEGNKVLQTNSDILAHMTGTSTAPSTANDAGAAAAASTATPWLLYIGVAVAVALIWKMHKG